MPSIWDWDGDWTGVGEQASTCSAALQRIGGDGTGTGTVLMVAPAAAPPPPNVPTQSPRRQRSLGQGKVCLCYRELCPLSTERIGTVGGMAGWDLAADLLGCAAHGIRLNGASTRVVDSCRRMTGLPTFLLCMYSVQKTGFVIGQGRQAEYFLSPRCSFVAGLVHLSP